MTEKQLFSTAARVMGLYFVVKALSLFVFIVRVVFAHPEYLSADGIDNLDLITPLFHAVIGLILLKRTDYVVKFVFPAKSKD